MKVFAFHCLYCDSKLKIREDRAGRIARCPNSLCEQKLQLPSLQELAKAEQSSRQIQKKLSSPKKFPEAVTASIPGKKRSSRKGESVSAPDKRQRPRKYRLPLLVGLLIVGVAAVTGSLWMPSGSTGEVSSASSRLMAEQPSEFKQKVVPFLKDHCLDCHNADYSEGGVRFDKIDPEAKLINRYQFWDRVHEQVSVGAMPPSDMPSPPAEKREEVANILDRELNQFDCGSINDPGRVTVHRLNRSEYDNTIRDLLYVDGLSLSEDFPRDDAGYGFDNIGDVLTLSPILIERYFSAAETAVAEAIALPGNYQIEREWVGGDFQVIGSGRANSREVSFPSRGTARAKFTIRAGGKYDFQFVGSATQAGDEIAKCEVSLDGKKLETYELPGHRNDRVVKWSGELEPGEHQLDLAFINDHYDPENEDPKRRDRNMYIKSFHLAGPEQMSDSVYPESHRKLVVVRPDSKRTPREAAETVLKSFLDRAFRRPVKHEEVRRYLDIFEVAQSRDESYERSLQIAFSAVLVSPEFLFRIEGDPERRSDSDVISLNDYEIASRLSYFLWSSMPDEELFELASLGKLNNDAELERQVERMLADPKAEALPENFVGQWLGLRQLSESTPNPQMFPEFKPDLIDEMQQETKLLFKHILDRDLSVTEMLTADYSFMNEDLANYYGIKGVTGKEFQQVSLKKEPRRGLLSHAGILTLTSFPNRTSPVKRGEWVLENLLAQAPPPAPPSVPSLEETQEANPDLTFREQLELHRKDPVCNSCHKLMDGIGFGLQKFDAIGRWREEMDGRKIDARGELPDGASFDGPLELIDILSRRPDHFTRCVTEKMLTYALGRGLEWYDRCTVDEIVAATRADHYRLKRLIVEIVKSEPFRKQRAADPMTTASDSE